jgi:chromate reductase
MTPPKALAKSRGPGTLGGMGKHTVAVLIGSLRKASYNRRVAHQLIAFAPETLECRIVEIRDLPLYDEDREDDPPAAWTTFRQEVRPADGVLFVSPEYNRSIPGALKNAIDVGSRPYGHSVWQGKPGAIVTASPGRTGGFGANHQLRQAVVFLNVPTMQLPEVYLGNVDKVIDDAGQLTDDRTRALLRKFMESFAAWIEQVRR